MHASVNEQIVLIDSSGGGLVVSTHGSLAGLARDVIYTCWSRSEFSDDYLENIHDYLNELRDEKHSSTCN